jgi:nucleoporin NUP2
MSGKRGAADQLTRENLRDEEEDDGVPSQPIRASADVLAKRKILKPRGRLGKAGGVSVGNAAFGAAPSTINQTVFGAFAEPDETNDKPNPFGESSNPAELSEKPNPFGAFAKPVETAEKPANAFSSFAIPAETTEKPVNAFGMFDPKPEESKPVATFNFIATQQYQQSSLVSNKSSEKASKIKALNDNFYDKLTQEKKINPVANFTPILKRYIDYYDRIDRDVEMEDVQEEKTKKALPASPAQIQSSPQTSFNFGQIAKPSFIPTPIKQQEKEPTRMDESIVKDESKDAILVDSDNSDDDIKVEGPVFTLAKPPTTTNSIFKLTGDATQQKSSGTGPTFTFTSNGKSDSVFRLKPTVESDEKKEEKPKSTVDSTNVFAWSPSKTNEDQNGSKPSFELGKKEEEKKGDKQALSFNFGAPNTDEAKTASGFSFGAPQTGDKPVSAFNFGAPKTDDKLAGAFSFGARKTDETKPALSFNFTASKSDNSKPATFNFGEPKTDDKPTSTFNFGSNSTSQLSFSSSSNSFGAAVSTSGFNFNFSKSNDSRPTSESKDEDKPDEAEPDVQFKPITQLTEQVSTTTGEEEETVLYSKRSKLLHFNTDEKKYESKGVGEVKLLQHKTNSKTRLLLRSEGAERVILNTLIVKSFEYNNVGKGVRVPVFENDKLETYVLRVKTDDDANALVKAIDGAKENL